MEQKLYRLFYKDVQLGEIIEEDYDFPTCFGKFTQTLILNEEEIHRHLQAYILSSIEDSKILFDNESSEDEKMECEKTCGEKFGDLIESDDWFLVDESGKKIYILIPFFCADNEINYRSNPSK